MKEGGGLSILADLVGCVRLGLLFYWQRLTSVSFGEKFPAQLVLQIKKYVPELANQRVGCSRNSQAAQRLGAITGQPSALC